MTLYWPATQTESDMFAAWCAERIPHVRGGNFGPCQAAAVLRANDRLAAVVVFHDWQPGAATLQLSMAAETPAWASRDVIRALFAYAFRTAGANKLWTAVPHDAERVLKFNRGVGLKPEATLRHHFGHKRHAVINAMLASEWKRSRWFVEG